ncbi:hypothetical protein A2765_02325 [Candidatus Kaiserbacteria bacterium RIFCSPHIGHO2_01_FULL_56_24]|uniref:Uncharacterized protein n=1 Tax=Candidatus Kaiserbacteria bacterium RIFCSPHIGHO2_01_FULL_56_24 TaxID=1798487 RepID=A0A1F6DB04_9BACT|nr:MAG: hypothetical protein A2765_02325 [Candidatus Kaiserbacteria bacterium RIFCSPHIGHO2_01_FULL_56_24]
MPENSTISTQNASQGTIVLGSQAPGTQTTYLSNLFNPDSSLASFFSTLFYAAIAVGAILAVLRLGYAGFLYMTSDVWSTKQHATGIIQETVLGLLLLLAVWLILNQINPDILNLDILRNIGGSK